MGYDMVEVIDATWLRARAAALDVGYPLFEVQASRIHIDAASMPPTIGISAPRVALQSFLMDQFRKAGMTWE